MMKLSRLFRSNTVLPQSVINKIRNPAAILGLVVFLCPMAAHAALLKYNVSYEEQARLHSDTDSIGSKTGSLDQELAFSLDFENGLATSYTETQKDWHLFHPDNTEYVRLVYRIHKPGVAYNADIWNLKLAMPVLDVVRREELYQRIDDDKDNQFVLPSLVGGLNVSDFLVEAGAWKENDFQPLDYHRYTLVAYMVRYGALGYDITESQKIKASLLQYERIYPEDYELEKDEVGLVYRLLDIFSVDDCFYWREISIGYEEIRYTTETQKEFRLFNYFKFNLLNLTHFLSLGFIARDHYSTFREGLFAYSLIEESQKEDDLAMELKYSGFTRLSDSNFFLSWGYKLEDSLTRNAYLYQTVNLGLDYNF